MSVVGPSPATGERGPESDAARSLVEQLVPAQAVAVDAYFERHPAESQRIEAAIREAWVAAEEDPTRFAFLSAHVRAQLISIATLDHAEEAIPSAVARLRDDLSDYLATIEGLTATSGRVDTR